MIVASEPSLVISDILCQVLTGSTLLFFFVDISVKFWLIFIQIEKNFCKII